MFLWFSVRQTLLMIKLSHSHFVTRPIDSRLIPRDLMTRTNKRASAAACSSTVKKKLKRITINLCCPFTWIFMAQRVRRRESGSHKDTKDTQHPLNLGMLLGQLQTLFPEKSLHNKLQRSTRSERRRRDRPHL